MKIIRFDTPNHNTDTVINILKSISSKIDFRYKFTMWIIYCEEDINPTLLNYIGFKNILCLSKITKEN